MLSPCSNHLPKNKGKYSLSLSFTEHTYKKKEKTEANTRNFFMQKINRKKKNGKKNIYFKLPHSRHLQDVPLH